MKSWTKPTNELVNKALTSIKKVTARKYFFSRLENPLWLKPLAERGCFKYPPKSLRFDDGTIRFPYWPEIQYLRNVCTDLPNEVIHLVVNLPEVDNPVVYDGILDIALQLPIEYSVKLKDKILEYAGMEHQFQTYRYANLLGCWIKENQISDALELLKILITFAPDPQSENKQTRRNEDPMDTYTLLEPTPRMLPGEYRDIMLKGILPLTESDPYKVACILINTTANMIRLRRHKQDLDKQDDLSESWCPRLPGTIENSETPEETLVHTLTFACEKVFEKKHKKIGSLDNILRKQQWKIFKRLRHHLYAQNPQQTKLWMLELILNPEYYNQWKHSHEFRLMIQHACEHFGDTFLTKEERTRIFETILAGPSKANYQEWLMRWLGQEHTEEGFLKYKRLRQRIQLAPFASVLFGKYKTHLQKLETEVTHRIFDEDYLPSKAKITELSVSKLSPRSSENITNLPDEVLLDYINKWEDEDKFLEGNKLVEINIEALANAFQTVFRESIMPDANRLKFWMENCKRIERPIYVRVMIYAMQANVKAKNFDKLDEWLKFSEWVLSHPDREHKQDYKQGDESREDQNWTNSRRAVGDFIGVCLEKDIDVPITARENLARILEMLCTQYDWNLDENNPTGLYQKDPLTEGINNTRSRALEALVKFGFWLWRQDSDTNVSSEVTTILEKRFASGIEHPLTLPEYAVLGMNYPWIVNLNKTWTIKHKSDFFPQEVLSIWLAVFESLVKYSEPSKTIFEILQDDFNFALEHLTDFKKQAFFGKGPIDILGEHLFTYYLWDMYPLIEEKSLLEQYYQQTDNHREHWANLFNHTGHRLSDSGKHLDEKIKDRIIDFFEWRLEQKEPTELKRFTLWLQAECLDAEWRLNAYSKVIDVCKAEDCEVEDWEIYLKELCQMLPKYTAEVVECFFKLTNDIRDKNIYIQTEEAKTILKAGLHSSDTIVHKNAERALNNLLRADKMEYMDLVIDKDKQASEL